MLSDIGHQVIINAWIIMIKEKQKKKSSDPVHLFLQTSSHPISLRDSLQKPLGSDDIADQINQALEFMLQGSPFFFQGPRLRPG
jgi:hypothetical protein